MIDDALLSGLLGIISPSGDESFMTNHVEEILKSRRRVPKLDRIGNTLIARRGKPLTAVFAHVDQVGFTLAHDKRMIPIGHPDAGQGGAVRSISGKSIIHGRMAVFGKGEYHLAEGEGELGSRWVYDTKPAFKEKTIMGAALDNRFGVYTALWLLEQLDDVLVAFTACEEASGRGALDAGRWIRENTPVRQALIADITWATEYVQPGKGPAVSLRDAFVPRQAFVDAVRRGAERSGVPFQLEVESSGSSDGGMLERSGLGLDWVFVGAPETGYHTAKETLVRSDAENMLQLYAHLLQEDLHAKQSH